jgi:hypothetical protein
MRTVFTHRSHRMPLQNRRWSLRGGARPRCTGLILQARNHPGGCRSSPAIGSAGCPLPGLLAQLYRSCSSTCRGPRVQAFQSAGLARNPPKRERDSIRDEAIGSRSRASRRTCDLCFRSNLNCPYEQHDRARQVPQTRFNVLLADIEPSRMTVNVASVSTMSEPSEQAEGFQVPLHHLLSGGYSRGTSIRPRSTAEGKERPDVDIVMVTHVSEDDLPEDILQELCDALKDDGDGYEVRRINRRSASKAILLRC